MTTVVGRAWGWVRSWGGTVVSENTTTITAESQKHGYDSHGYRGWTSWIWEGWRRQGDQSSPAEVYQEAQEKLQPVEKTEALCAGKQVKEENALHVSRWWNKYLPTAYILWQRKAESIRLRQRKYDGSGDEWNCDIDGDMSDYRTPPPSPTPESSQPISPFRLFVQSWTVEILPEHYEICFNFLRHLFDLLVVGFLWTVSSPAKLILEVLGVHGALRLWLHGMAMFFVSTVGMAGLLWLIQEYLPQFALIYGIIQALVISVSVRRSGILSVEEGKEEKDQEEKETDEITENIKKFKDKVKMI